MSTTSTTSSSGVGAGSGGREPRERSKSSASASGGAAGEGDWICPDPECANLNFARRSACNRCGKDKPIESQKKKCVGIEIGKAAAEKSRGLFSADDWQCTKCGNVNWARRSSCNVCNAPKFKEVEERTGYGGGYNDRGVVEYIEREESDDEFDEFGRRKKKFRKIKTGESQSDYDMAKAKAESDARKNSPIAEKKDDDDDESVDEEEEEDDDDDDEDGDLSKYDLSDWGTTKDETEAKEKTEEPTVNEVIAPTTHDRSRSTSSSSSERSSEERKKLSKDKRSRSRSRSRSPRDRRNRSRSRDKRSRSRSKEREHKSTRDRSRSSRSKSRDRKRRSRSRDRKRR